MKNLKLILFLSLFLFPVVKADGCGIVCPKHPYDLFTFTLVFICNFTTWTLCHIFAFFFVLALLVIVAVFWIKTPKERKGKIKIYGYALLIIFFLIMIYSYIRTWVYSPVSIPKVTPCYQCSNGIIQPNQTQCFIGTGGYAQINTYAQNQNEYYSFICQNSGSNVVIYISGTMDKFCVVTDNFNALIANQCPTTSSNCFTTEINTFNDVTVGSEGEPITVLVVNPQPNSTIGFTCFGG